MDAPSLPNGRPGGQSIESAAKDVDSLKLRPQTGRQEAAPAPEMGGMSEFIFNF